MYLHSGEGLLRSRSRQSPSMPMGLNQSGLSERPASAVSYQCGSYGHEPPNIQSSPVIAGVPPSKSLAEIPPVKRCYCCDPDWVRPIRTESTGGRWRAAADQDPPPVAEPKTYHHVAPNQKPSGLFPSA